MSTNRSPFCVQTSSHAGLGTGMFFAIILVIGAIALAAYSYFRLNRRTIGFQHFEVRWRKMGTWAQGSSLKPSPWLWAASESSRAAGRLAHTPRLLGGASAPKRAAVAAPRPSSWPRQDTEEGDGLPMALRARGLAWRQIHQGPRRPLILEDSQDRHPPGLI